MRGDNRERGSETAAIGWDAYDAAPRDGPWMFVAVTEAWDRGEIRGAWVRAAATTNEVLDVMAATVGQRYEAEELAVVDQVGIKSQVPEALA
jgi:hypothetical protein